MTFPSRPEYESMVYSLLDDYVEVVDSTLHMYSTSALTSIVQGRVILSNSLALQVVEALDFKKERILQYSYTGRMINVRVFRGEERIRWYDSQPHPENPDLASTFPHHLHDPPNIKHNRKPAPGINFTSPNLHGRTINVRLIADCIVLDERALDEGE